MQLLNKLLKRNKNEFTVNVLNNLHWTIVAQPVLFFTIIARFELMGRRSGDLAGHSAAPLFLSTAVKDSFKNSNSSSS